MIGTDTSVHVEYCNCFIFKWCFPSGPLFSVGDLSYKFSDSTVLKLLWSSPFTLPGTTIIGYNISVTSNGTTTDFFTPNSYYVLWLHNITDSPCNEMNITVSGYNGLRGDSNTISGVYLPSGMDYIFIIIVRSVKI